jgi:type VI secretion system protein ImpK
MTDGTSLDNTSLPNPAGPRRERLALLYQGMFTAIVRVQSGRQPLIDANAFQKRMEGLLAEIEREAIKVGYRNKDIEDANYAVVAFLDETIQRSDDPNRNRWSALQAKMFEQAVAGDVVFDRLKSIRTRRDSADLADLLEIYYLCFLLGYEGRYALDEREKLEVLMDDLRDQIARVRGVQPALSPDGAFPAFAPAPIAAPASPVAPWRLAAVACAVLAVVGWVVLKLMLNSYAQGVVSDIVAP